MTLGQQVSLAPGLCWCSCERCAGWTGEVVQLEPFVQVLWSKGRREYVTWFFEPERQLAVSHSVSHSKTASA